MSLIMGTKFSLGTSFYRILPSQHISYRPEWQNAKAECHDDRHQPEAPHRHSGWGLPEPPNTRPLKLKNHTQKANTQNHVRKTPSSDGYQQQYGYQIPQSSLIRNAPKRTEAKTKKQQHLGTRFNMGTKNKRERVAKVFPDGKPQPSIPRNPVITGTIRTLPLIPHKPIFHQTQGTTLNPRRLFLPSWSKIKGGEEQGGEGSKFSLVPKSETGTKSRMGPKWPDGLVKENNPSTQDLWFLFPYSKRREGGGEVSSGLDTNSKIEPFFNLVPKSETGPICMTGPVFKDTIKTSSP